MASHNKLVLTLKWVSDSFENTTESIDRLLGLGLAQRNITLQNAKIKLPLFMFLLLTDSP